MEWTKVKPKHFLFTDLDMKQKGCLITLLCLTAHLERMPTEKEMTRVVHHKALTSLQEGLKRCSIDLQQVLNKVLEDVSKVNHDKTLNAERQTRYRKSHEESNALHNSTDKKRREEIRNNIQEERFSSLWGKYPYKDGKQKAQKFFNASVKDDLGFKNICVALDNYLASDAVQKGYIKKGENWFRDWKDWVDFKPPVVQLKERPKV